MSRSGAAVSAAALTFVLLSPLAGAETLSPLAQLGQILFFDSRLSANGTVSCASCHQPEHSFADPRRFSIGQSGRPTRRHAPALINRPRYGFQFWDGRALSLEAQVLHPLRDPDEMGLSAVAICHRLSSIPSYREGFVAAFGDPEVTPPRLLRAISAFIETLRFADSEYHRASQAGALPAALARGEALFFGKLRCGTCHLRGPLTDERFHNTGISWKAGGGDLGRGALSGRQEEIRAFKTPTLFELVRTAPYMHDGSLDTLEAVVEHYRQGGAPEDPSLDPAIRPLELTAGERDVLIGFLRSLSAPDGPPFSTSRR